MVIFTVTGNRDFFSAITIKVTGNRDFFSAITNTFTHGSGSTPGVLTVSFFLVPVCTNKYPVGTNLVKLVPAGTNRMLYLRT